MLPSACDVHDDPSTDALGEHMASSNAVTHRLTRNIQLVRDRFWWPPLAGIKALRDRFAVAPQHIEFCGHHSPLGMISLALLPQPLAFRPERIKLPRQRHRFAGGKIIRASAHMIGLRRDHRQGAEPLRLVVRLALYNAWALPAGVRHRLRTFA